jgi:hypothetical protein
MAGQISRSDKCRGSRLSLGEETALTAIHPGEHLAEELEALNMSAAELARQLDVPTNRITSINSFDLLKNSLSLVVRIRYFLKAKPQRANSKPNRYRISKLSIWPFTVWRMQRFLTQPPRSGEFRGYR